MKELNLPSCELKIRDHGVKTEVFDFIRKKYVVLTSEEWVRQHFIHYLVQYIQIPPTLIAVESALKFNRLKKRSDIVIYNTKGKPCLVVECKAPEIALSQDVFDQAAMYNMTLKVPFLVITNGMVHYVCRIDHEKKSFTFLKELPPFNELNAVLQEKTNHP
jgi:type I site-specific restriction endonuclease